MRYLTVVLFLAGCGEELTQIEAQEALGESVSSARAEAITYESTEVHTDVTIGDRIEDAAEKLRAWWESQVECATITREANTVTVDFGDLADSCTYNGHTYGGVATVAVDKTEGSIEVSHGFEALTNGEVTLDGTADVTWTGTADDPTRHVVHEFTWTDAERTERAGSGDRTQELLDPELGLDGGIVVDGTRDWTTPKGDWHLDIDAVEMRGQDPVPQAGTYTLTTPRDKTLTLTFARVDEDTIAVTADGIRGGTKTWNVTLDGEAE